MAVRNILPTAACPPDSVSMMAILTGSACAVPAAKHAAPASATAAQNLVIDSSCVLVCGRVVWWPRARREPDAAYGPGACRLWVDAPVHPRGSRRVGHRVAHLAGARRRAVALLVPLGRLRDLLV